jgi:hypothetical protein
LRFLVVFSAHTHSTILSVSLERLCEVLNMAVDGSGREFKLSFCTEAAQAVIRRQEAQGYGKT